MERIQVQVWRGRGRSLLREAAVAERTFSLSLSLSRILSRREREDEYIAVFLRNLKRAARRDPCNTCVNRTN